MHLLKLISSLYFRCYQREEEKMIATRRNHIQSKASIVYMDKSENGIISFISTSETGNAANLNCCLNQKG